MRNNPSSIRHLFLAGMVALVLVSTGLWGATWTHGEYSAFKTESASLRDKYLEAQQDMLRNQVGNVVDYIRYMVHQTETRLKLSIRERVDEAWHIAMNIFLQNRDTKTTAEIQKMIKDALRPIRFNNGRGYFFAFNLEGVEELFADRPEMEGRDMLPVAGAKGELVVRDMLDLVRAQGEGFYEYTWTKPGQTDRYSPKIAFVKLFEPYGWVIGTGEYLDDVRNQVQEEVLDRLANIRFGTEGYLFGSTFRGEPLFSDGKITKGSDSIWDLTDSNGVKIFQEQKNAVKQPEGGFVRYRWPKMETTAPVEKLAHVRGVSEWGWIIGAGVYLDTLESEIAMKKDALKRRLVAKIERSFLIFFPLIVLVFCWVHYLSRRLQAGMDTFSSFFERAATQSITIDPDKLHFREFQMLARFANKMVADHSQAVDALRESEQKYRALIETTGTGYVILDPAGRVLDANAEYIRLTGHGALEEILGRSVIEWTAPRDLARNAEEVEKCLRQGSVSNLEIEYIDSGKELTPIEINATVLSTFEGVRILSLCRDITERKRAEEALRESEGFLGNIIENIPHMIFVKDARELRFVRLNKAGEELLGYSRKELTGKRAYDLFPVNIADCLTEKDREALRGGRLLDIPEEIIQTRCMGERILHTKKIPILDGAGNPQYLLGISEDITIRKRHDEERTLLATVVEQSEENVLITDNHRTILYINPAFERSSGYLCDELRGQKLRALRSDQHDSTFYRMMKETLDRGDVWVGVIINKGKDGTDFEIEGTISPLRDTAGDLTHYVAVGRNMSRFRKLERELQQVQKMDALGTLAGGIAHDFNNILTAVMGFIELECMEAGKESRTRHRMDQALAACRRARDLVRQILTFSRQSEQRLKPFDIVSVVEDAVKMLRATLPSTIDMRLNIKTPQAVILGDPTRVHQVLVNLCTNAAYAMSQTGGVMDIGLAGVEIDSEEASEHLDLQSGSYVRLTVSDTGHGMDRKTVERIFEPFFTTKGPGEGTGMGLAVVHGIVKSHGGMISVYSEPGKGSSFRVFFPRMASEVEHIDVPAVPFPTGNERILLVDDEEVVAAVAGEMLEALGYEVVSVHRSVEALDLFQSQPDRFDLIITDLTMPGLTGMELAAELLSIRGDVPIILCTGFTSTEIMEQAMAKGIREVMMKPYIMQELAEAVRGALDRGQS